MDAVEESDVKAIIRLLGAAAGMTAPLNERRRFVLDGLARLIGAELWVWLQSRRSDDGDLAAYAVLDGGIRDDAERGRMAVFGNDPLLIRTFQRVVDITQHSTVLTQDWLHAASGEEREVLAQRLREARIGASVISCYPIPHHSISAIGLYRRDGGAEFTARERALVHLVLSQVEWLHCIDGAPVGNSSALMSLSNRQRQTLLLLLGGSSPKQIAIALQISEYTVRDYVKQIYRRFDVSGRGELLSLFINGGHRLDSD